MRIRLIKQTFIPVSMGESSANGTSRVLSSQSRMPKDHMSQARTLAFSGARCSAKRHQLTKLSKVHKPSGDIQAGE